MASQQPFQLSATYEDTGVGGSIPNAAKESLADKVTNGIKSVVKTALFMETLRNINWSRVYDWYAEMDGVPNPFHRGGVIGLPLKSLTFKIAEGTNYPFNTSSVETLNVPRAMGELGIITLDLFDDEQQTLARFFERWYNQIYNPYRGVLPVTEACKQITIYKQKCTRRNLKRVYYNIDENISNLVGRGFDYIKTGKLHRTTEGYDFLVYPFGPLQFGWATDANDLNTLQVQLQIVHFVNQDFGNPVISNGVTSVFDNTTGVVHNGTAFLDKLADFI